MTLLRAESKEDVAQRTPRYDDVIAFENPNTV
jgi:hypothetical protein